MSNKCWVFRQRFLPQFRQTRNSILLEYINLTTQKQQKWNFSWLFDTIDKEDAKPEKSTNCKTWSAPHWPRSEDFSLILEIFHVLRHLVFFYFHFLGQTMDRHSFGTSMRQKKKFSNHFTWIVHAIARDTRGVHSNI